MQKKKVFITRVVPGESIKQLRKKGYQVGVWKEDKVIPRKLLLEKVKGIDGLLCLLTDKIDAELMDAAGPNLKVIANYAVGFDNVDIEAAKERKIAVSNTPGVLDGSVAEHSFALMMTMTRKIVPADSFTRAGKYKGWDPDLYMGNFMHEKTLGVVGTGRIGSRVVASATLGYNMNVIYTDVARNVALEKKYKAKYMKLPALLKKADYISLHVPLLPTTHHLIGEKELRMMKKTAYLVNTARGPIIDEKALVKALRSGQIRGAALDVLEKEPKLSPGLARLENVVLTPHIASATEETRTKMSDLAVSNIIARLSGKRMPTRVKI
ncbi:2-hydroxyacid dehydrogenase [Patescibacteria group bacterium]